MGKFSLLVIGLLGIVCLYLIEAVEESNSLVQEKQEMKNKGENILLARKSRSAEKKQKLRKKIKKPKKNNLKGKSKRKDKKQKKGKKNKAPNRKGKKQKNRKNGENKKTAGKGKKRTLANKEKKKRKGNGVKKVKKSEKESDVKKENNKQKKKNTERKLSGRKALTGSHCEYVDLCDIDRMAEDGCRSGQKFVIKSPRGTRRQFLMVDGKKIIAFLKNGQKITDCVGNLTLTDVTSRVTCKTVAGAGDIKLQRLNDSMDTTVAPEP